MDEFVILNRILLYATGITFIKHEDVMAPFNYSPFISLIDFDNNEVDKQVQLVNPEQWLQRLKTEIQYVIRYK